MVSEVFRSNHFNTDIFSTATSYDSGIEQISKPPSLVIAGFRSRFALSLYRAINRHPNVLPSLKGPHFSQDTRYGSSINGMEDSHCYSNFDVGDGESNLLQRMWCLPLVEDAENFISTDFDSSYSLEPSVPYALIQDNAVSKVLLVITDPIERMYAQFKEQRLYHPLDIDNNSSFDDIILLGMAYGTVFSEIREMVTNGTAVDYIVHYYYQQLSMDANNEYSSRTFKQDTFYDINAHLPLSHSLLANSIFFPAVVHYVNVLGVENVRVVQMPSANPNSSVSQNNQSIPSFITDRNTTQFKEIKSEMMQLHDIANEVFLFLGLCPYDESDVTESTEKSTVSNSTVMVDFNMDATSAASEAVKEMDVLTDRTDDINALNSNHLIQTELLSQDVFDKLILYLNPFQELLKNFTRDLNITIGHDIDYPPVYSVQFYETLPQFSPGWNESRPLLWFESKIAGEEKIEPVNGRKVPKLIPQRLSKVENGYNTTLGMLAAF
eukprot:CAMPEP_0170098236 /NCGR_PEP_ID=MMETSP0020_2-20130122/315_1 /TAXON_ID=98059 /ORGANISM="Dinobryon sp., Strain UTEXLB2267" /LENGTH=493 /DNA_ID=CAMNT_0010320647 /DNA_START=734 /DNA_END=2215 /DNA_ORIENTATION=+